MTKSEEYMQKIMDASKGDETAHDNFMFQCHRSIETGRKRMAEWAERLLDPERDPLNEMGWADKTFENAARVKVHETVVRWIEMGEKNEQDEWAILHEIFDAFTKDVMNAGKWPSRSTSVCTNLTEQEEIAAKAKFVESMRFVFKDEPEQP